MRRMPGGAAILPAAARYRNITAALPEGARRDGQAMFDFTGRGRTRMNETRFKPVRAGIINLWDYSDEEFVSRTAARAARPQRSGKTKALEVLFPFILDGSLDARRLDPFSGENRTMKANLLYRGPVPEHGYVWMEFARPGETVTLVVGLSVHKNMDRPRPSFYVTGKRMGIDFGLLSADSRPLTAKQLTAILGRDAYYGDKRGAYT